METDSMTDSPAGDEGKSPPGSSNADRWLGVALLVLAAVMFVDTFFFKTFQWDPLGMAFWPRVLLGALVALVAYHIVVGNVGDEMEPMTTRAFIQFGVCMVYLAGLTYLGFFISTPILVFGLGLWLRKPSWKAALLSALSAIICTAAIYLIFEYSMDVELPRGIWG